MESTHKLRSYRWVWATLLVALAGCESASHAAAPNTNDQPVVALPAVSARELVLTPHEGDHPLDAEIRRLQLRIPNSRVQAEDLDRLGWVFISRARELGDPGSYNMALQCALAMEAIQPHSHAALLLRGHSLHSLHHFAEAERVARQLVAERGLAFDFGLLGDVLVDRGALDEAVKNYQRMMDIRPDSHAYARAAHVRYLKGDLAGALKAMQVAAHHNFDDNVNYEIHVALGPDVARGRATITYQFEFQTTIENRNTILESYTNVVQNVNDAAQNLVQRYTVRQIDYRSSRGSPDIRTLGTGIVPPNNQGRVTPFYNQGDNGDNPAKPGVASAAQLDRYTSQTLFNLDRGHRVFAGQRDDGFYADINAIFPYAATPHNGRRHNHH